MGDDGMSMKDISAMCVGFSGAEIKSACCDALIAAFHRAHGNLDKQMTSSKKNTDQQTIDHQDAIYSAMRVERHDLVASIQAVQATFNKTERFRQAQMLVKQTQTLTSSCVLIRFVNVDF